MELIFALGGAKGVSATVWLDPYCKAPEQASQQGEERSHPQFGALNPREVVPAGVPMVVVVLEIPWDNGVFPW